MARDIDKRRAARRRWYHSHKEEARASIKQRKQEMSLWLRQFKSSLECEQCGENHPACLEFHHRSPDEKESAIAQCIARGWSKKRILAEVEKCDVLCSNCHRKLHWE